MEKKLKSSKRGLTFSFDGTERFAPGKKYRYFIDVKNKQIVIVPSDDGGNTISRKKSGNQIHALIDIRSKEVRKLVSEASYLEVRVEQNRILVFADQSCDAVVIEKSQMLQMAAGAEEDVICTQAMEAFAHASIPDESRTKIQKELPDVIKVISLFAGAGMLDYSFACDPQFQIVYAAEYDADAAKTYRFNIGPEMHEVDIRTLYGEDLPHADVLIGGPPCQPMSAANRHETARFEQHPEGDMFAHYIRLVRETKVRAFLIENVKELITAKDSYYLKLLRSSLPEFQIHERVVKDSEIGGYTNRKRAVIIGSRINDFVMPEWKLFPPKTVKDALQYVDDTWPNAKDITQSSELVREKIAMVPEGGNWQDLPERYWTKSVHSNMYRRLDRNQPSVTIANWRKYLLSPPKWDNSDRWDRILSVSEAAALQGLKKDFMFLGSLNAKQQQVANGVTQAIARFAKHVIRSIFAGYSESVIPSFS